MSTAEHNRQHIPRRSGVGARVVLIPGTRKAYPHPLSMKAIAFRKALIAEAAAQGVSA